MSTDAMADASAPTRQLPINLFTRSAAYAIPPSTYFIPAAWRRFQLSELINKVLGNDAEGRAPVPFDFVVEGEVLRGSLDAWARKHRGADEESAISVEYVRSVMPPTEVGRWEQEDWVSGLSLARPGHVLVSSYLSHVRVLPLSSSEPLYTLNLPTSLGATSCAWLSPPSATADVLVAAGGVDRCTHVFSLPSLDPTDAATATPKELYTLMGHTAPISSVTAGPSGEVVSASWDGALNLYALPAEVEEEHQLPAEPTSYLPGQKRRRKAGEVRGPIEGLTDGDATGEGGWRRAPDAVWRGHKGRVGGAVWDRQDAGRAWSAGWDGSVRGWDAETGAPAVVRQGPSDKALLCIDQFAGNGTLATGGMDRTVCLWDTREATSLISLTLSTASPVPSLACHPASPFTLAAATYGGAVQIWDVRSPKHALFTMARKPRAAGEAPAREVTKNGKVLGERLLAVDWDGEVVVAGGEDGEVGLWRARGE